MSDPTIDTLTWPLSEPDAAIQVVAHVQRGVIVAIEKSHTEDDGTTIRVTTKAPFRFARLDLNWRERLREREEQP